MPYFRKSTLRILGTRCRSNNPTYATRSYAVVSPLIISQAPPPSALPGCLSLLDKTILTALSKNGNNRNPSLKRLLSETIENAGVVLDVSLPYESRPSEARRPKFALSNEKSKANDPNDILLVAHTMQDGSDHKVMVSSGFALNAPSPREGESLILTYTPLSATAAQGKKSSGSFVITGSGDSLSLHPVSSVVSSLAKPDLLLLSCRLSKGAVNTLPTSPYLVHSDTSIRVHFVMNDKPADPGWTPWIGRTWRKWVSGKIDGYRDFAGNETKPGTYDNLSHLLFTPPSTPDSHGGPIIDEESGAVVGVVLGTRIDANRITGAQGWGVPAETIYEMFSLPGLEGKK
ncbi:hypothetical protein BDQ12DRAFT_701669 [Crucibulum laeve]|uniref:Trypsin-like cysteine/serine peptidase domain-containing protein n=1 Tax=Crucibulum laeve TaxID=68775 RepID=A0A5C3LGH9_9AGAR|nr:hypothetical protein BDQ12DRAFT_701669 [Crucibulum laeve]